MTLKWRAHAPALALAGASTHAPTPSNPLGLDPLLTSPPRNPAICLCDLSLCVDCRCLYSGDQTRSTQCVGSYNILYYIIYLLYIVVHGVSLCKGKNTPKPYWLLFGENKGGRVRLHPPKTYWLGFREKRGGRVRLHPPKPYWLDFHEKRGGRVRPL